jgi:hypothetical protein
MPRSRVRKKPGKLRTHGGEAENIQISGSCLAQQAGDNKQGPIFEVAGFFGMPGRRRRKTAQPAHSRNVFQAGELTAVRRMENYGMLSGTSPAPIGFANTAAPGTEMRRMEDVPRQNFLGNKSTSKFCEGFPTFDGRILGNNSQNGNGQPVPSQP